MNFYEFAGQHPILTVVLALIATGFPPAMVRAFRSKPRTIILNQTKPND